MLLLEHVASFPEDFCQSTDLLNLKNLRTYVSLNMPSSDLAVRVQFLLKELEDIEPTDADPNGKMT
jgi:ankyrin repeat protein